MKHVMRGNRRVQRKPIDLAFIRKADGRLRPAKEGRDIGDVWAELERAKLKEAIEADQKKQQKTSRFRKFFRKDSLGGQVANQPVDTKTVEIKIQFPPVRKYLKAFARWAKPKVAGLNRKQWYFISAGVLALVVLVASFNLYGDGRQAGNDGLDANKKNSSATATADSNDGPSAPEYTTVLPEGKTIEDLGGWGRVSPPGQAAVFAYRDSIDEVQINVTQQPLPDSFKKDTAASVIKLAESYSAKEKLNAGGADAYIGTSEKGPQSVILAKGGLLILIKSASKISNASWEAYLSRLQ